MKDLRKQADYIIEKAIKAVLPDEAVKRALQGREFSGQVLLVAIGKAAYQMAKTARDVLGSRLDKGIVITKYGHVKGPIEGIRCFEAGHPVPDENGFRATQRTIELVSGLNAEDTVIFLISGGGSALFEKPLIPEDELQDVTTQLLKRGASITEMNTIRKRLSGVKGGRFAELCAPAKVFSIVLSDIIGDPLDMIASGPTYPDSSTCEEAINIAKKYELRLSDAAWERLKTETPKELRNVETLITGSVRELCRSAKNACEELGYETEILTDTLDCEAKDAGRWLAGIAKKHHTTNRKLAFIAGGETVVHVTGTGLGGRNQELTLAAAEGIKGMRAAVFSVGSDGTDGPTDAAGGYVDGESAGGFLKKGIDIEQVLRGNDSYHALEAVGGLIVTGPTGTNVNDFACVLVEPEKEK
ncbi:MAG: glycerate kinase [Firmicutes bacterium]|nr:glycerate kinase [Bacillota bacterium]